MKPQTDAERAKAYRERKKLREAGLLPPAEKKEPLEIPRHQTLSEFVRREDELVEAFEWIRDQLGLPVEQFHISDHKEKEIEWTHNLIHDLDIALSTITTTLSSYWTDQIDREVERLKAEQLTDPATKDEAISRIVRFMEIRKNLQKRFRLTLQNYEPTD